MDTYAILDMRGLVQRSLHSGTDRDSIKDSITGRPINTPGHALDKLLVDYLLPILGELRAKQIIAVWDGGNLYRRMLYPAYKQTRREKPSVKGPLTDVAHWSKRTSPVVRISLKLDNLSYLENLSSGLVLMLRYSAILVRPFTCIAGSTG